MNYYTADLHSEAHYEVMGGVSLSVCLSVCLSHASIYLKNRKPIGTMEVHHTGNRWTF